MTDPISVIVRYPDHVETILIAPTGQRCVWREVKPKPINNHRADKTRRILEWREAYQRMVGGWPTNEQTAEAIGCSVSTIKYHLKKVRNNERQ